MAWDDSEGSGTILEAGRSSPLPRPGRPHRPHRGRPPHRGFVRLAVEDSARKAEQLTAGGAELVAPATETSWGDLNARGRAPDGMQLTLFTVLGD